MAVIPSQVQWRIVATDEQLEEWSAHPERAWITVEYRLEEVPGTSWRVHVVTHSWLRGMLALPYTAHALPALLIVPDGPLAGRRAAIARLLDPAAALDLSRVAERLDGSAIEPAAEHPRP